MGIAGVRTDLTNALKEHFGFDAFKGEQEAVINSILSGRHTFVIMPTGGGKSLCYQLPALISEGTAIVISPLIALMKNQVDLMRSYSSNDSIAHFLNSSLTKAQQRIVLDDIYNGKTKLLYVAPETLTKEDNLKFFRDINISFIAVDEAHCISEWGHDFRPEYRRIRYMIDSLGGNKPIIALTATATPKVRSDIVKNLRMTDANIFIASFLRENLYYEIKPKGKKTEAVKDIVKYIKNSNLRSGIIYCLNRKTTEEIAEILNVNGIKAAPYHAGLESSVRSNTQDHFLMEEIDVIVATIAFGMGIDKPDVRFVIHFNIPKSLENYYQETGRAGRDGLKGDCIAYYRYDDVNKLEKFLRDKPVAEREIGAQHLMEITAYSESSACRRQFLLHYFGESYDTSNCGTGQCDNCKYPKEKTNRKEEVVIAINAIKNVKEKFSIPATVDFLIGKRSREVSSFGMDQLEAFASGSDNDATFWNSILRHALLNNLIVKDIEEYGILKITDKGREFLKKPFSIMVSINRNYDNTDDEEVETGEKAVLDPRLVQILKDLRKQVAHDVNLPPYVIFQDPSLEDMATQYPITLNELSNITGVSRGKASRYGRKFVALIENYVEENEIDRPVDFTVKSVNKSGNKIQIIQNIDRKISLEDIAGSHNLSMDQLILEIKRIVDSGTKLDLGYYINNRIDMDTQDIIIDYFRSSESDSMDNAFGELEDEGVSMEEVQMMHIKFLSEMGN